jgi:two-component system response regulator YesN
MSPSRRAHESRCLAQRWRAPWRRAACNSRGVRRPLEPTSNDLTIPACNDRRVARVLRHVVQDLTQRATCEAAARIAGLDRAYFSKRFRSVMRVSFSEWNARVRVDEAKRLLRAIDLSITAVGASVGYDDVTTFERVFKRLEGVCPREHRRGLAREIARPTPNAEIATPNAETLRAPRE